MSADNYKLYKLIYERFVASQMAPATYDSLSVVVNAGDYGFKVSGKTLLFAGFTRAYKVYEEVEEDSSTDAKLPKLEVNDIVSLQEITKEQKFTKPPVRYTEASLIKTMEEKGIGRPATYAPTILVLLNRAYMQKEAKYLQPTELGTTVTEFLEKYFPDIMNISFTAQMEDNLDKIEEGTMQWQDVIKSFYGDFEKQVVYAVRGSKKVNMPLEVSDVVCEKCGAQMVVREGKTGKFLACPNYPNCKNIKSIDGPKLVVCSCPDCGKDVVEKKTRFGKIFYGCSNYPACKFASWEKPTNLKCPTCKNYLTVRESKTTLAYKCSNKDCNFSKTEDKPKKEEK